MASKLFLGSTQEQMLCVPVADIGHGSVLELDVFEHFKANED